MTSYVEPGVLEVNFAGRADQLCGSNGALTNDFTSVITIAFVMRTATHGKPVRGFITADSYAKKQWMKSGSGVRSGVKLGTLG